MVAQTVSEMQKLEENKLLAGVVDEIINEDPIFARMPFDTFVGQQLDYVRESTRPVPQFFEVDDEISTGVGTKTEVNTGLKLIGHQTETPGFSRTLSSVNNQREVNIRDALLGLVDKIGDRLIYGNSSSNATEFNGLQALIPSAQKISESSSDTPGALQFSNLDTQLDLVKKGMPDLIAVTRNTKRKIGHFVKFSSTNTNIRDDVDGFGKPVIRYNEIPIQYSDRLVTTEATSSDVYSAKTGGSGCSLFVVQFGFPNTEKPGIFGIQGPNGVERIDMGWAEKKDNLIDRVIWYLGTGLGSTQTVAAINGIAPNTAVTL